MLVSVAELAQTLSMEAPVSGSPTEDLMEELILIATEAVKNKIDTTFLEPYTGEITVAGNLGKVLELNTYTISITEILNSVGDEIDLDDLSLHPFNPTRRNADNSPIFSGLYNKLGTWGSEDSLYTITGTFGCKASQTPKTILNAIKATAKFYADSRQLNAFIQSQSGASLSTLINTEQDFPPYIDAMLNLGWKIRRI